MELAKQSKEQIEIFLADAKRRYEEYKGKGLRLDMSRGKPSPAQLDLSAELLSGDDGFQSEDGVDCRNYGELSGIREMKRIFAELLGVPEGQVFVGGNSTLNLMFNTFSRAFVKGLADSKKPWSQYEKIKFLCPVPGYDRHYMATEYFGIEMIGVPMTPGGPDMDVVEQIAAEDDAVKGIWCVPVFSNPDGCVYSDETVERLAKMRPAAEDFTVIWDNAYCVHSLYGEEIRQRNILDACAGYGHANRVLMFTSTNKITFAGAGVCCVAGSRESVESFVKTAAVSTIGYDKLNQLRHARFLKNAGNVRRLMERHAALLRPKFEAVFATLDGMLKDLGIAEWTTPRGGYFISLNALPGTAKRVFHLCREAGVTLTTVGAAYPYGVDPEDKNIRIAPSYPPVSELLDACRVLCLSVQIAAAERLLADRTAVKNAV